MKIAIDVSLYQDSYDYDKFKLLVDNGVDACIIRAGCYYSPDRMLSTFVEWCRRLKIPYALYWYFYPQASSGQANKFIEIAKQYPDAKGLWLDVEEHTGTSSFLDGYYKSEFIKVLRAFPDKLVGIYSGGWVLNNYIPNMWKWANKYPYWNAHYVKYYTWWINYVKTIKSISQLEAVMAEIEKHPVGQVNNMPAMLWQCVTYIPFAELTEWQRHLDWNICSDENFAKLFGVVIEEPLPEPEYKSYEVISYAVWVRKTPGGTIVGYKWKGDIVVGLETVTDAKGYEWLRIHEGFVGLSTLQLV